MPFPTLLRYGEHTFGRLALPFDDPASAPVQATVVCSAPITVNIGSDLRRPVHWISRHEISRSEQLVRGYNVTEYGTR
jgi:hypothetical protein